MPWSTDWCSTKYERAVGSSILSGFWIIAFDVVIGLPTVITLRARLDYYRMLLKIRFKGDSEILNYEYERENGNTSEAIRVLYETV